MTSELLTDLSHLFSVEAFDRDMQGEPDEAERLWDISHDLHEAAKEAT